MQQAATTRQVSSLGLGPPSPLPLPSPTTHQHILPAGAQIQFDDSFSFQPPYTGTEIILEVRWLPDSLAKLFPSDIHADKWRLSSRLLCCAARSLLMLPSSLAHTRFLPCGQVYTKHTGAQDRLVGRGTATLQTLQQHVDKPVAFRLFTSTGAQVR